MMNIENVTDAMNAGDCVEFEEQSVLKAEDEEKILDALFESQKDDTVEDTDDTKADLEDQEISEELDDDLSFLYEEDQELNDDNFNDDFNDDSNDEHSESENQLLAEIEALKREVENLKAQLEETAEEDEYYEFVDDDLLFNDEDTSDNSEDFVTSVNGLFEDTTYNEHDDLFEAAKELSDEDSDKDLFGTSKSVNPPMDFDDNFGLSVTSEATRVEISRCNTVIALAGLGNKCKTEHQFDSILDMIWMIVTKSLK